MGRSDQTLENARDAARSPHPSRLLALIIALLVALATAAFVAPRFYLPKSPGKNGKPGEPAPAPFDPASGKRPSGSR